MSYPTEDELIQAFASILDPEKRDAAIQTLYVATQRLKRRLTQHYEDVPISFDDVRGEAIRKILVRKTPIITERGYGYLRKILVHAYEDAIRREPPQPEYHDTSIVEPDGEPESVAEIYAELGTILVELLPTSVHCMEDVVEHLCTVVLPGRCGRMKEVPERVRVMYEEFEQVRLSRKPANFSAARRKEHERLRDKVEEVVKTYVTDEKEKGLWLGFVEHYLYLREPKKSDSD